MSARKVPPSSATKTKPATPQKVRRGLNMNSTVMSSGGRMQRSNASVSSLNSTISVNSLPTCLDNEFEEDLAYSEHLQALMTKDILEKTLARDKATWDADLTVRRGELFAKQCELLEIEHQHEQFQLQMNYEREFSEFRASLDRSLKLFDKYGTKDRLREFLELLKLFCNKLELKNIKPLQSQEEYDKLAGLFEEYNCILMKFRLVFCSNPEGVKQLAANVKEHLELNDVITSGYNKIKTSNKEYVALLFKTLSVLLADKNLKDANLCEL